MNKDYRDWLTGLKQRIGHAQLKVASAANKALLQFYWELGQDISEKLESGKWGTKLIQQLAADLKKELPKVKGFSRTNLYYIKQFYETFSSVPYQQIFVPQTGGQMAVSIVPHLGGQLPWGHIKVLLSSTKTPEKTQFYLQHSIINDWSRDVLAFQIKNNLYERKGNAITNFQDTLPRPQSELAQQTIKDPYVFDFLDLTADVKERDIENQLIDNVSKFLLELGKGFAFVAKQYHLEIAEKDFYIDLLFYHVTLKCYVIIELKNTKFIPEYAGKLNFYLSAVDETLKSESDQPSIGILMCRDKNNLEVEFSLRGMSQPIGVSEFNLTEVLPDELKSSLPTIEEIEREL